MAGLPRLSGTAPVSDLYGQALSSAYDEFRIIDPDLTLEKEANIWDKIRRDGKVSQAISQRTASVAAKRWNVQPATDSQESKDLALWAEDMLKVIPDFREARRQLAAGIFRARAYAWVNGKRRFWSPGEFQPKRWWTPTKLKNIDKNRLELRPVMLEDGTKREAIWHLYSRERRKWEPLRKSWPLLKIVFSDEEGRLGYGRGLLESLYFLWWAKQTIFKEGLQGVMRWAQGFLVAKVSNDKPSGGLGRDGTSARNVMRDELVKHRGKNVAVVSSTDEIALVTGGGEGHQIVMGMLEYVNNEILSTGLGGVTPFGGAAGKGSLARAEVEQEVSDEQLEFDRGKLDETLNRLIGFVISVNRPQLAEIGLGNARTPNFETTSDKKEDPEVNARVAKTALESGAKLRMDEYYQKIGYTQPSDDDEVLEPIEAAPVGDAGIPFHV